MEDSSSGLFLALLESSEILVTSVFRDGNSWVGVELGNEFDEVSSLSLTSITSSVGMAESTTCVSIGISSMLVTLTISSVLFEASSGNWASFTSMAFGGSDGTSPTSFFTRDWNSLLTFSPPSLFYN